MCESVIMRRQLTAARRHAAARPGSACLHVRASAFALLLTVLSIFATLPALASGAPSPAPVTQSSAAGAIPSAASARNPATPTQPSGAIGSAPQMNAADLAGAAKSQTASPEVDRRSIISYLGEVIGWYRHREVEETLAREPAETLFLADDRQMASDILKLAFESARAEAALLKVTTNETQPAPAAMAGLAGTSSLAGGGPLPGLSDLLTRRGYAQAEVDRAQAEVKDLETRLAGAAKRNRDSITRQLVNARGLDLAQSRVDSLAAIIEFETGSTAS